MSLTSLYGLGFMVPSELIFNKLEKAAFRSLRNTAYLSLGDSGDFPKEGRGAQ
tara:strand:- start:32 stop:190 length:159 start_codon:yes stop_codon:yes gene_type:complete